MMSSVALEQKTKHLLCYQTSFMHNCECSTLDKKNQFQRKAVIALGRLALTLEFLVVSREFQTPLSFSFQVGKIAVSKIL